MFLIVCFPPWRRSWRCTQHVGIALLTSDTWALNSERPKHVGIAFRTSWRELHALEPEAKKHWERSQSFWMISFLSEPKDTNL